MKPERLLRPELFLDLDGVLGDFDGHYENKFGVRPKQDTYEPPEFWDCIRGDKTFFRTMPPMPDMIELWNAVKHLQPVVLTGIPYSIKNVQEQKREWVAEHISPHVRVICCRSRDKYVHGWPGDVLVDDRTKYARFWVDMGGVFVHHRSAATTITALQNLPGDPFLMALGAP